MRTSVASGHSFLQAAGGSFRQAAGGSGVLRGVQASGSRSAPLAGHRQRCGLAVRAALRVDDLRDPLAAALAAGPGSARVAHVAEAPSSLADDPADRAVRHPVALADQHASDHTGLKLKINVVFKIRPQRRTRTEIGIRLDEFLETLAISDRWESLADAIAQLHRTSRPGWHRWVGRTRPPQPARAPDPAQLSPAFASPLTPTRA